MTVAAKVPTMAAMKNINGVDRPADWHDYEANAATLRRGLTRILRRELVHDPRAAVARIANDSVEDLVDEAFAWTLENWKAKPTATLPSQWLRKRALRLLDESLDREALAAESRAEERVAEGRILAHEVAQDDTERAGWIEIAELAGRRHNRDLGDGEGEPFDGLLSDPQISSPDDRLFSRETLGELDRALGKLTERRRRVIAHRYLDGLAVGEIAYLLDASVDSVEAELAAGLKDLQLDFAARA